MNEREDYLDRLLRGMEETPGDESEDFLENYDNKFATAQTDEFLQAFEKSMSQGGNEPEPEAGTDMDFDMDDLDHIVSNVKNGTLDDLEEYGSLEDGRDLPIEESLKGYEDSMGLDEIGTEFNSGSQDYINTMDDEEPPEYESGGSNQEMLDMLSGIGVDDGGDAPREQESESPVQEDGEIPGDELESMAKELAMEIDELGLGSDSELDSVLEEEPEEEPEISGKEKKKKDKKGKKKQKDAENAEEPLGFWQKLGRILFGEEEELEEGSGVAIPEINEIENISDENMDILRELENKKEASAEDEISEKARKKKEKKEQREQKKKERAEKKAQKAKEKQAKPKKEKKAKEPKAVEKTKPLPKKPVCLIMLVAVSLVILINLMSSQIGYSLSVSDAKKYYEQGDYVEAYTCFNQGEKVKAADEELYNKARLTAYVQQQLNSYKTYQQQGMYAEALNALICGVGRHDINATEAAATGAAVEYEKMLAELKKALKKNYSMTLKKARELYDIRDKEDYTYTLYDVIDSLGLSE